jgi:hypothetical protein
MSDSTWISYTATFIPDASGQGWRHRVRSTGIVLEGWTRGSLQAAERDAESRFKKWRNASA